MKSNDFGQVYRQLDAMFKFGSSRVEGKTWQGTDVSNKPDMVTHELMNIDFTVNLGGVERLSHWRFDVEPNLPWADDHFEERVCGYPINPGVEWKNWPWGDNADKFREKTGMFNHNYMERYWPKYANHGAFVDPHSVAPEHPYLNPYSTDLLSEKWGIRGSYGDLNDLIDLLCTTPDTRQAYLPIFFPEDTGIGDGGRKPCTLGYQFIVRDKRIHVWYPLRSCDYIRHFRDDIYLTVRLLLWVLDKCREKNSYFKDVTVGTYSMHCTSLHIFENDYRKLMEDLG